MARDWETLIHILSKNKDIFGEAELKHMISIYVPIALNDLYKYLEQNYTETNYGNIMEDMIKMKYQKDQILEEDEDSLEESSEEEKFDEK